ncbi:MAG: hypothetical protein ILP01_00670 [Clostridia bacterium]|nr:hypothetical protein [Clostridia bacterium]
MKEKGNVNITYGSAVRTGGGRDADEGGAVQIVEMSLVLPLVLAVTAVLILFGLRVADGYSVRRIAARYATAASREIACPGYISLYRSSGFRGNDLDMAEGELPDQTEVNTAVSEHRPYRYFSGKTPESFAVMASAMKNEALRSSFVSCRKCDCSLVLKKEGLRIRVTATVRKYRSLPSIFGIGGYDSDGTSVSVTAAVTDSCEFVRDTDTVLDFAERLAGQFGIDKDKIGEKTDGFIASFREMAERFTG